MELEKDKSGSAEKYEENNFIPNLLGRLKRFVWSFPWGEAFLWIAGLVAILNNVGAGAVLIGAAIGVRATRQTKSGVHHDQ